VSWADAGPGVTVVVRRSRIGCGPSVAPLARPLVAAASGTPVHRAQGWAAGDGRSIRRLWIRCLPPATPLGSSRLLVVTTAAHPQV
jgi:hypothetical protein